MDAAQPTKKNIKEYGYMAMRKLLKALKDAPKKLLMALKERI